MHGEGRGSLVDDGPRLRCGCDLREWVGSLYMLKRDDSLSSIALFFWRCENQLNNAGYLNGLLAVQVFGTRVY